MSNGFSTFQKIPSCLEIFACAPMNPGGLNSMIIDYINCISYHAMADLKKQRKVAGIRSKYKPENYIYLFIMVIIFRPTAYRASSEYVE